MVMAVIMMMIVIAVGRIIKWLSTFVRCSCILELILNFEDIEVQIAETRIEWSSVSLRTACVLQCSMYSTFILDECRTMEYVGNLDVWLWKEFSDLSEIHAVA